LFSRRRIDATTILTLGAKLSALADLLVEAVADRNGRAR
jgi:hypothetical protein